MLRGLRVGEMDRRITIQSYTTSNHATTNQPVKIWSDLVTVWGRRFTNRSRTSDERFEANQQVAGEVYDFEIRNISTAIDHKMRIYDTAEERHFYIIGVNKMPRQGKIILTGQYRDNG